jgi:tRNA nucleotidyltransferase (CCA-adding enzyme)
MKYLIENDFQAYIIGGAVRDYKLGIKPHDYDIFTNATGEQILKIFPSGNIIGGEERQEKILTVIVDGVEISQYRKNGNRTETGMSLEEHQATCDFTINAMAMDIEGNITDKYKGQIHLIERELHFVGDPKQRIAEDTLRLLRGIRFAAKYNFKFEEKTKLTIESNAKKITELPQERVREELMKILQYPKGIEYLIFYGYLDLIFPEWETVKGMGGGDHHAERVDTHMLNAFETACKITNKTILRLAAFLHDIGKGITMEFKEDGGVRFHEHENKEKVGFTADLSSRMFEIKRKFPDNKLVYFREFVKESDARRFEAWLKKLPNRNLIKFVAGFQEKLKKVDISYY